MTYLDVQAAGIPLPAPTALSRPYWEGCQRGELRFQRCRACRRANFIPTYGCRECLCSNLDWEVSAGSGTIYSWTVVWRPQTPAFAVPYAPVIVELDEGFLMLSNVVHCHTDQLKSGLRVRVRFEHRSASAWLPYFVLEAVDE
jgi:uncharacterized OB-fold protein